VDLWCEREVHVVCQFGVSVGWRNDNWSCFPLFWHLAFVICLYFLWQTRVRVNGS
jgi:hypothetical protein